MLNVFLRLKCEISFSVKDISSRRSYPHFYIVYKNFYHHDDDHFFIKENLDPYPFFWIFLYFSEKARVPRSILTFSGFPEKNFHRFLHCFPKIFPADILNFGGSFWGQKIALLYRAPGWVGGESFWHRNFQKYKNFFKNCIFDIGWDIFRKKNICVFRISAGNKLC